MISKLIVWGVNREKALARMKRALYSYKISGVSTNLRFLERIMEAEDFATGKYNTQFIEKNEEFLMMKNTSGKAVEDLAIASAFLHHLNKLGLKKSAPEERNAGCMETKWKAFGKRRGIGRF
jgi:acetyl-CoA carboxylase biotin carboxylase subunit